MRSDGFRKFFRQAGRHDKLYACAGHFPKLILRNPLLERKEVFGRNAVCLGQYLSPSIPTGGFHGKHHQSAFRKGGISIGFNRRKQKSQVAFPVRTRAGEKNLFLRSAAPL